MGIFLRQNIKAEVAESFPLLSNIASFPGPTHLSITCSMEKRGEPGVFSHVSMA